MNRTRIKIAVFLSGILLLVSSCVNEAHDSAKQIVEKFLKEYSDYSCGRLPFGTTLNLLIKDLYPDLADEIILMDESEKSAYWIRVDKYEITDVEDKGTRIIVTTECITPDLRKETVTFSFDKESITSLKEKTPIESSKGLLEYKKNKLFKYYTPYFDETSVRTDIKALKRVQKASDSEIFSWATLKVGFEIIEQRILKSNSRNISGYVKLKNTTEYDIMDIDLVVRLYDVPDARNSDKRIIKETRVPVSLAPKNENTYIEWSVPMVSGAMSCNIFIDYNSFYLQYLIVMRTYQDMGLQGPDLMEFEAMLQ